MTLTQQIITIAIVVLGTMLTRFLPFLLFPAGKPTPKYVRYLGKVLPPAVFGMLVIYCFRNGTLVAGSNGMPEILASAVTVGLQAWKRNLAISIAGGTLCYMALVQLFFPISG